MAQQRSSAIIAWPGTGTSGNDSIAPALIRRRNRRPGISDRGGCIRPFILGKACADDLLALVTQMGAQDMGKPKAVAPLQHVEDRFVLLHRQRPALLAHRRHVTRTADPRG